MTMPGSACGHYKYFTVIMGPLLPGRKTRGYMIVGKNDRKRLGLIKWYGPWRQYCFYPEPQTVWNTGCLEDIQDFLNVLKEERKK